MQVKATLNLEGISKGRKSSRITRVGRVNNDEYGASKNMFYNLISPLLVLTRQEARTECAGVGRKET